MSAKKKCEQRPDAPFCVRHLRGAIDYVRQFADDKMPINDYFQVRINGGNFECGTHEWGGDIDLPSSPFEEPLCLNVYELSDYLKALPQDEALSVSLDGGLLAVKCGRAIKKFEVYPRQETNRSTRVNGEWCHLPPSFCEMLSTLGRQKFYDAPVLVSNGGLLFYRCSRLSELMIFEGVDLPDFQMNRRFVDMVMSFAPTMIAIDANRVGFSDAGRRMFAPLTVSNALPVAKLLERTRDNIAKARTKLTFDVKSLGEALKVLSTEGKGGNEIYITVEARGTDDEISMSCNRTECAVRGTTNESMSVKVSSAVLWNMVNTGVDVEGTVTVQIPHTNEVVYVQKGNLTLLSSTQRKNV